MIDTHAHLHFRDYQLDRDLVITRDFAIGITAVIEVNLSRRDWPDLKRLIEADPRILGTVGIHAHEASRESAADLRALEKWLDHPEVVAIGETGIDTYRDYAPIENQRDLFAAHVNLARSRRMPLVIHCREAFEEVFAILDRDGDAETTGVFHCFSGGLEEARGVLRRGYKIGLGGNVTYAPEQWAPVLKELPLNAMLLETDCPFLKPAPERRGRNEPAWVFRTAELIAGILGLQTRYFIKQADRNAVDLFGPRLIEAIGGEETLH